MGSSVEPNFKTIDASVGDLVWVQRRNGSWWPGQIMGLNEVSEDNLVPPKSGTPVRLLGREDASIDWYNLEKSKRVKPFWCGEYDECIEKAKASAASGNRRAVKYARREDAIIHALKIENARHASENCKENENNEGSNPHNSDSDSAPDLSPSDLSFEEPKTQNGISKEQSLHEKRKRTPNDSEDDGTEVVVKRMRGLEDLGINGSKVHCNSSLKRKRTQVANVQEFLKRKRRRRPLNKVLQSTTVIVSVPVSYDQIPNSSDSPLQVSGIEYDDSRASDRVNESNIIPGESGLALNAFAEEKPPSGISPPFVSYPPEIQEVAEMEGQQSSRPEAPSSLNEGLNETGYVGSTAALDGGISQIVGKGSSKWQSKGKRNSRTVKGTSQCLSKYAMPEDMIPPKSLPFRRSRYTIHSKYETSDFPGKSCLSHSKLYTVEVEVNANYRQQHVPLVSLSSKMSGKAVVGHPLTVQLLEDGYCDRFTIDSIKSVPVIQSSQAQRTQPRFSPNKLRKSGLLSKKTRKLSSLTTNNESEDKKPVAKKVEGPVIACIPLKLIFSRINEDVNGFVKANEPR